MAKVLVVEDNELNLKLFCDLLTIKDHEVILSKDGFNILEIVIEQLPDLILMDIQLADVSGLDLIKILKNNPKTNKIPIIVITAFAMKNEVMRISESGCDLYLSKPVSIDNFFFSVERFISNNNTV
ncbi:MAG: response regulator [Rickettsiaceae bacterium]|jgi:two-component system cell cycle response regulator DivK|uniref:response regulator n=1 Tax=Candidatus Megaera polyxenophila TaxID=988779 RepID=UPI001B44E187|nr:response regulator [Rickettsiaceae bacterium]NBU52836.1 response regulator [Alphaproteobacteria bacterium]UCM94248.1 MAG: response regulator [Candidatus Megaira endosymbiont of Mesostigma viride]WHA06360.1 response regulator [Candidatus Megaera polyxenophila]MCE2731463.1 response regulator [Rickettsiaceae bacterium]